MAAATSPRSIFNGDAFVLASRFIGRALLYLLLIAMSLWFLAPLFWMFMSSFMPLDQVGVFPVQWIPRVWQPENYTDALKFWNFGTTFRNTMFVTLVSLVGDIGLLHTSRLWIRPFFVFLFAMRCF